MYYYLNVHFQGQRVKALRTVGGIENWRFLATEDLTVSCAYASLTSSFTLYVESKAYN